MPEESAGASSVTRRLFLQVGAAGGAGAALVAAQVFAGPFLSDRGLLSADGAFAATSTELGDLLFYIEAFPTSPLILSPFTDRLLIPKAMAPVPKTTFSYWAKPPGSGVGQQNSLGNERHQIWPGRNPEAAYNYPDPIVYQIKDQVSTHSFTTSQVLPIDSNGKPAVSFDAAGKTVPAGTIRTLPLSTIYGFNGTFPGPMINAEYGKPALVRFENHLDENPLNLDRQDFGAPDWSPAQRSYRPRERRQPALLIEVRAQIRGLSASDLGRPDVPELAGRGTRR